MRCPLCEKPTIFDKRLDSGLNAKRCTECGGLWVSFLDYRSWLSTSPQPHSTAAADIDLDVSDSEKVKTCLDCGRILIKYRVGHGVGFRLDHCNHCNGIWFDKNEWESLVKNDLHDHLIEIFSREWQDAIKKEALRDRLEARYEDTFGSDFEEIKRFRQLLNSHEHRSMILAYLTDEER